MSSLSQLLAEEGFERKRELQRRQISLKHRDRVAPDTDSISLPLYICDANHGPKTHRSSKRLPEKSLRRNASSVFSWKISERSDSKSSVSEFSRREDPTIDEVAIRAVVSILSGYVGRFIKDENFREKVREKCVSCLARGKTDLEDGIFEKLEMGIESVDKLLEEKGISKERVISPNAIQNLSVVASTNPKKGKNPYISACAQLYLAIVHKIERNDGKSAHHLLQVFCVSPFLARTHLVPDLWEHFFLPHLLHLKVWYTKELECLRDLDSGEKEKKMKALSKVYNQQMDKGTVEFAFYYKKWLQVGVGSAPVVPKVPLPVRPYRASRRSMDTCSTYSSVNNNLYRAVFGSNLERKSANFTDDSRALRDIRGVNEEENLGVDKSAYNEGGFLHGNLTARRSSSQFERNRKYETSGETQKSDKFRLFTCQQTVPLQLECLISGNHLEKNSLVRKKEESTNLSINLSRAIASICSSDSLSECEVAIRIITKAWLDSHGNAAIEAALSKASLIEGMLEVLFASEDDEILELVISILAELVSRNDLNRLMVLNFDPQLEIFLKHLRSSSLFLKAAALLYIAKPEAKQMISVEWVPLVLRVIEFGDQLQTLFTVQCSPLVAAFYLLDQLLTGFDEDRNLDNARQVVSLGGLSMLLNKIEVGDTNVRINAAMFISCCIRADGSCRNYLAENLSIDSVVELFVLEYHRNPSGSAFALLIELLCLSRRTQTNTILKRLKDGWGGLDTMHIFLAYLQKAPPEERPLVAAILLLLDLLEDPSKWSIYREDAVEAIIAALDCQIHNEHVQEQSARALLMLGGRFSYTGEATIENWLLEQAGFNEFAGNSYEKPEIGAGEEAAAAENWQRKAAAVLFKIGNRRLLDALSVSIANGVSSLSRASLITLVASLNHDKDVERKVLASYSLLNLTKTSECVPMLLSLDKDQLVSHLKQLRLVTWTADELLSIIK